MLMYPIESVRRYWNSQTDSFDYGSNLSMWVIEAILVAGLVSLLWGNRRILMSSRRVSLLLLLLFPALMIDFLTSRIGSEQAELYTPRTSAPSLPSRGARSPRFVWIIFDELDQRVVFERRPGYLELPELDRLSAESVSADHAAQTATFTAIALPSLISGRIYATARAVDASTLEVVPQGSTGQVDWRNEPNVFTRPQLGGECRAGGLASSLLPDSGGSIGGLFRAAQHALHRRAGCGSQELRRTGPGKPSSGCFKCNS